MSIFEATFSTGQIVAAAGITPAALQSWIRRDFIIGHGEGGVDKPGKAGLRRAFTIFNLMEIATAAALVDAGVDIPHAFRAAHRFAHVGGPPRLPALPFPGAVGTLIAMASGEARVMAWKPGEDVYAIARSHLRGHGPAITLLDVGNVFERAVSAVGHNPQAILSEAYGATKSTGGEVE